MPDIPSNLYQKNHIVVRYFHDGNAYGFRSTLTGLVKDPYRLYFRAYPETIEPLNLRKNQRHVGLLKNAHLWRYAASLVNRRTQKYASFLGFCVPCIWAFLNSLLKIDFFNRPMSV